ncbi:unnamed protein product [Orchesella dallaii]|uniref:Uncharacterized protein n=1 Tax=Orchesella dallaii TaxID=48710 RepID=A0ABP1RI19_9HEXA
MNNTNPNLQQQQIPHNYYPHFQHQFQQRGNNYVPQFIAASASTGENQAHLVQRNRYLENLLREKNTELENLRESVKFYQNSTVRKVDYDEVLEQNQTIAQNNEKLATENDTLRSSLAKCEKDLEGVNKIVAEMTEKNTHCKTQIEILNTCTKNLVSEKEKLNKVIENLTAQITALEHQDKVARESNGTFQANRGALLVRNRKLEEALLAKEIKSKAELEEIQKKLKEAQTQIQNLKCGRRFSTDQINLLTTENETLLEKFNSLQIKFTRVQKSFRRARAGAAKRWDQIDKLRMRLLLKSTEIGTIPNYKRFMQLSSESQTKFMDLYYKKQEELNLDNQ